ncbi:hypothetical protein [Methylomonas fluvii]|uniref:Response receiver domain-containing protein n=1 Tax=Methylomonas fluvii TaxID=1854564 RepID=A0ABR9D990_9GAMM|nr:hypothetical protein [Methylomonas fluvii]MBD9359670.1 hypothetical protein [Methylomonas fluvii]CAD6872418.1 hypothetical protein [Methylomonas fluvii]
MFRTPIILIDDNQEYLDTLNRAFALSGQPCLPIRFDGDDPDNTTGVDHVNANTKHARVIAIDINLREAQNTQDARQLYPTIEKVLEKLNPIGPYYLIFWSKYKELPEEIFNLLSQRSKDVITAPIGWSFLDKTDFSENDINKLKDKLSQVIGEVKVFKLLHEWESRTIHAASDTLSELYRIAASRHDKGWKIDETREKLINLLTHIAHASIGHQNAKDAPNHSIETGLMPILEDNLLSMASELDVARLNNDWKSCLNNLGDRKNLSTLELDDISNLNTFYNVAELNEGFSKLKRGVFVRLSETINTNDQKFKGQFGRSHKALMTEEFLFNNNVGGKINGPSYREKARQATILGWLEIGAACDHAQRKNRLHKYVLAALVPSKYLKLVSDSKTKRTKAHEGIYRSPIFRYKDKNYVLLVSFRYVAGLHENSEVLDIPMFRLKEQIINEIAFAWGNHSIRPGITSFSE